MRRYITVLLVVILLSVLGYLWAWRNTTLTRQIVKPSESSQKEKPKRIIAVGDISCAPNEVTNSSNCNEKQIVTAIEKQHADNILLLGDLQYDKGQKEYFRTVFAPLWQNLKSISYSTPGNHEYYTKGAEGYFDYWNGNAQSSPQAGERGKGYYSFDIGKWHVISLNSNCEYIGGCTAGSPQATWLDNDLQQHTALCTIAFWHHPVFTSGKYKYDETSRSRGRYLWQILTDHGAEIVLNGHDHLYERFEPQMADGKLDRSHGIQEFIVGTGGKSEYTFQPTGFLQNHAVGFDSKWGYLELLLKDTSYSWDFRDVSGASLDSGTGKCHS